ncbi:MAG: methylmalonyl Co-A mutase-associated GTPase MeaB [Candidatus Sericytochromatia bacterium]|nr:methylmalonyl Co-A mutase-associated GTPase MeaB [Candidatus Sericytochromatia bacterium]
MRDLEAIARGVLESHPRAIARAISWLENGHALAAPLLERLYPHTGRARTIGVTGPPGAGKSTLVDRLVPEVRASGHRVGVVAVDPASPFSGGAILGDRVRLTDVAGDSGVFVRSMSSRGHLGGLAVATEAAAAVLDAAGFDVVVIETVGVGQSEIEIATLADTTMLVQPPHLGDGVQAVKAGIMEVPQVFVINKADLPGARQAAAEIEAYLDLVVVAPEAWRPPVVLVSATSSAAQGVASLWEAIRSHWHWCEAHGHLATQREARIQQQLWREAEGQAAARVRRATSDAALAEALAAIRERRATPAAAARALVDAALREPPPDGKGLLL